MYAWLSSGQLVTSLAVVVRRRAVIAEERVAVEPRVGPEGLPPRPQLVEQLLDAGASVAPSAAVERATEVTDSQEEE